MKPLQAGSAKHAACFLFHSFSCVTRVHLVKASVVIIVFIKSNFVWYKMNHTCQITGLLSSLTAHARSLALTFPFTRFLPRKRMKGFTLGCSTSNLLAFVPQRSSFGIAKKNKQLDFPFCHHTMFIKSLLLNALSRMKCKDQRISYSVI